MNEEDDIQWYQDDAKVPPSGHAKVPKWLIWTYILLPIWGIIVLFLYWNGSFGYLDRGYWEELQEAANTRYPFVNHSQPNGAPTLD